MVTRLVLVRHGETDWNIDRRLQGWSDIDLNPNGRSQAETLSDLLAGETFDTVLSSDLSRALQTARIAGFDPTPLPQLREMDFGELEGIAWDELDHGIRDALVAFDGFRAPGGESAVSFARRVSGVFDGLGPGRHLIVAHGGVLRHARRECGEDRFPAHLEILRVDWTHKRLME